MNTSIVIKLSQMLLIIVCAVVILSCNSKDHFNPKKYLTSEEEHEFLLTLSRYTAKAPEGVDDKNRFDKKYDAYYLDKASRVKLELYYPTKTGAWFLITQPAPSLTEKRHATGGHIGFAADGSLVTYEEKFRTWKMIPDTLSKRSWTLFDKMVAGESLEPYLSKNAGDRYIEFPDDNVFFDVSERKWVVKDPVH